MLIAGDVADSAFCEERGREDGREFGKLDILVNNAAFQQHAGDITDISDEHFDRTLKTNLYGYFYMARAAVPHMKPGGSIVMTRLGHRPAGQRQAARLLDDQGRHPRLHALAGRQSG